jgi:hypothetical protein
MLVIRSDQMDSFRKSRHDSFIAKGLPVFRAAWPTLTKDLSDSKVEDLLRHAILVAARYGITEGRYVLAVAQIILICGLEFEQRASCRRITAILGRRNLEAERRFVMIDALLACHVDGGQLALV